MSISFYPAGNGRKYARAIGCSLSFGFFGVDDVDESRKQLNVNFGFWWFIVQWQIWRQR